MLPSSRRLSLPAVLVAGSLAAACGKMSGPRPTLDVAIGLIEPAARSVTVEGGVTKVNCDARIQAKATGTGEATWTNGRVYAFSTVTPSLLLDSILVTKEQLTSTWGSPTIVGGETRSTTYRITAREPFTAVVEFRYQQSGGRDQRSTRIPVACGT